MPGRLTFGVNALIEQGGVIPDRLFEIRGRVFLDDRAGKFVKCLFRTKTQARQVQQPCYREIHRAEPVLAALKRFESRLSVGQRRAAFLFFLGKTSFAQHRTGREIAGLVMPSRRGIARDRVELLLSFIKATCVKLSRTALLAPTPSPPPPH